MDPAHIDVPPPRSAHNWQSLFGCGPSLVAARLLAQSNHFVLYVARDTEDAERVRREIGFFAAGATEPLAFPDWETLPYDNFSPHQDIISERLATLYALPRMERGVLVAPVQTLMQRLPPTAFVEAQSLVLETGSHFSIDTQRIRLQRAGYRNVGTVAERGEYAVRGSLMDIFPMGSRLPLRIDLDDDEIDSLRTFDPDTQRTIERIDAVRILPATEIPLDAAGIGRFRERWHHTFDVDVRRCQVYQDVSDGIAHPGVECYLPFFFESTATLFDYLPDETAVVLDDGCLESAERFVGGLHNRYESLRHDIERPLPEPGALYLSREELFAALAPYPRLRVDPNGERRRHVIGFGGSRLPDLMANQRGRDEARKLRTFVDAAEVPVLLTAETPGRRQHLAEFLARSRIRAVEVDDFQTFLRSGAPLALTVADLDRGTQLPEFALVTETEIFGHRADGPVSGARSAIDADLVVRNLTELSIGAPVVHADHGVGRYRGLKTLEIDGYAQEFLAIDYAEESRLYVPVTSLHLISRYAGADSDHAPLHRLGSDQWDKAKRRAAKKVFDVAAELLDIYARREARAGTVFSAPDDDYARFCDQFPFETTPDQQGAIDAVLADLQSEKPTDRLICGDVGFGKTEVAMRAAFVAIGSGKQVAVLAPTTLLAQQHYETFRDRFADWPAEIEVISRLRTGGEAQDIRKRLASGAVDIAIGTHRLLAAGIEFSDLGLVVIDEEHRFGVRQTERLRDLRAEVDVLALTATPIPRTLNMAISGMRELSIIATPPARRLSIKTFVMPRRDHILREAIDRELARGGQVFYLHNRVETIARAAEHVAELAPNARIGVGHGKMPKRALEQVMADFYHRRCNLLVCTTIIENGIDIPNANTIIVDRADRLGLAQLHQLRGRVGRSHRQAYAYLLTPDPRAITPDARKRLEAIVAAGELGVGFTLATHDLEIRGAGELLGEDQSGQIESIGFSLYMELLERAVAAIRAGVAAPDLDQPMPKNREVNLHVPALIPDAYLPDVHMRLILYKRIAGANSTDVLDDLKAEMFDRFGPLPPAARNLFRTTELKLLGERLGIDRIDVGPLAGRLVFSTSTRVDPGRVVRLIQNDPATYRLRDATRLSFTAALSHPEARFEFVERLLEQIAPQDISRIAATA